MSYSQNDEERYILDACADATRRQLLDIGAFHPTCMSNSRALIEAGWAAVLIEPSPGPIRALVQAYGETQFPGVTVVSAAVAVEGTFAGLLELRISDDGITAAVPTEAWQRAGEYIGWLHVPALTIPNILDLFGAFDFVSIDTEGTSVDLLKVLLATELLPRCICCEHDGRITEAQMAAQARGYQTVYTSAENIVLVHG